MYSFININERIAFKTSSVSLEVCYVRKIVSCKSNFLVNQPRHSTLEFINPVFVVVVAVIVTKALLSLINIIKMIIIIKQNKDVSVVDASHTTCVFNIISSVNGALILI